MGMLDQLFGARKAAANAPASSSGLQDPFARREAADAAEKLALALALRRRESTDVPGWPQAGDTAAMAATEPGRETLAVMPDPAAAPVTNRRRFTLPVGRTTGVLSGY